LEGWKVETGRDGDYWIDSGSDREKIKPVQSVLRINILDIDSGWVI
jgi:hypothetical protein